MHREQKVPEPDRQRKVFPSTVAIKTNGAIDRFLPKRIALWPNAKAYAARRFLIPTLPGLATGYDPSKVGMCVDSVEKIPRFPSYGSWVRSPRPLQFLHRLNSGGRLCFQLQGPLMTQSGHSASHAIATKTRLSRPKNLA